MSTKTGTAKSDKIIGTNSADTLKGLGGNDTLTGLDGNDALFGGDGDDVLKGGIGNDFLDGGLGADTLDGGLGKDTATFSSATGSLSLSLGYTTAQYTVLGYKTITSIENLIGSAYNDYLSGDGYANRLEGRNGNDNLYGNAGNDALYGGNGDDYLSGGDDNDSLYGGANDDTLYGGYGADKLNGDAGDDKLYGEAGNDQLNGGSGSDTLYGYSDDDTLHGNLGDDTLFGGDGKDLMYGDAGNDVLDGGYGDDRSYGGAGSDTFMVSYGADTFDGGSGSDTVSFANIYTNIAFSLASTTSWTYYTSASLSLRFVENIIGSYYSDSLTGNSGKNVIDGAAGNDILYGGAGDDTLIGGSGDGTLIGGVGTDFASFAASLVSVTVDLGAGTAQATGEGNDTLESIEGLIGSGLDDQLLGNAADNIFIGGQGDDYINGRGGSDTASYSTSSAAVKVNLSVSGSQDTRGAGYDKLTSIENVTGSSYDDSLMGSAAKNYLSGGSGDDLLQGMKGDDTLDGGSGFDLASFAEVSTALNLSLSRIGAQSAGSAGKDTLISIEGLEGGSASDTLSGSSKANLLIGNKGNDKLYGLAGNDTLSGGAGNDRLDGGSGTDTADYTDLKSAVVIDLAKTAAQDTKGAGLDKLVSIESIAGGKGSDSLFGSGGANTLSGGDGNDKLYGRGGTDILVGGDGNDVLDAGSGTGERLVGGAGNDRYMLGTGKGNGIIEDSLGAHDIVDASKSSSAATIDLATGKSSTSAGQTLTLAAGGTSTLPLDLVFLQDLSGSFYDDIATVKTLVPKVVDAITSVNRDSAFGVVGFVDKPISPFGASSGDYVYKLFSPVSDDGTTVATAYDGMTILNGNDTPEAQLEALFQVAKRADGEVGFRDESMRVVVLFTDAEYHVAGDGEGAGITKPNDGDGVIEGTGTSEDYPSVDQLKAALEKAGIFPIFAVTDTVTSSYKELTSKLGTGGVVNITESSSNIVSAIRDAAKLATRTSIEDADGSKFADVIKGSAIGNTIHGNGGHDTITGLAGNDVLAGGSGNDKIDGGSGADRIYGGSGKDFLIGGSSSDTFVFDTKLAAANIDTIDDFDVKSDRIWLDNDVFAKAGAIGDLTTGAFHIGAKAHDANDRIIYDKSTGKLWYDDDGTGSHAAVQFAVIDKALSVTSSHFDIIG
jgi:Ca2+-binding RTX toxin-like protein